MTTARRGPYRKGLEQRERILAAAADAFARSGFAGASLRSIALAVGVGHATVVQYFGSKEALLLAVLEAWDADVSTALADREGIDFLRGLASLMHDHEGRRGMVELFLVMSAEASDPAHPAHPYIVRRSARVRTRVERELEHAHAAGALAPLAPGEAAQAAREVTAMMNGLELQWLLHPDQLPGNAFAAFLERWLAGLGAIAR